MDRDTQGAEASDAGVQQTPRTRGQFDDRFDHCFDLVWAYVSQRTGDHARSERIVRQVLESTLELLANRRDPARDHLLQEHDLRLLKAASERLIGESLEKPLASREPNRPAGG